MDPQIRYPITIDTYKFGRKSGGRSETGDIRKWDPA